MGKTKNIRIIIVALPGTWQKMIQRNLEEHPSVNVVGIAHGSLSAVQLAREHRPDLLLVDSSIPVEEAVALIQKVKLDNPATRSIVLTDTNRRGREITLAGADYVCSSFDYISHLGQILDEWDRPVPRSATAGTDAQAQNPLEIKEE